MLVPSFQKSNHSMAVTRAQVIEIVAEEDFISTLAEDFLARSLHLLRNLFMVPFGAAKAQFPVSENGTMLQVVIIDMPIAFCCIEPCHLCRKIGHTALVSHWFSLR